MSRLIVLVLVVECPPPIPSRWAYLDTATNLARRGTGAPTCSRLRASVLQGADGSIPITLSRLQVGAPVAVSRCARACGPGPGVLVL